MAHPWLRCHDGRPEGRARSARGTNKEHLQANVTVLDCIRAAARLGWLLLALALLPASAQIAGRLTTPASAPTAAIKDPLDRSTPRRAVAAFARAAERGDLQLATRYAQIAGRAPAKTEALVGDLAVLMDRYFHQPLGAINDAPEGALDDGLPFDRERVGPLRIGRKDHYIELVRVNDAIMGPVWLISADTLARIADVRGEDEARGWLERTLPPVFLEPAVFDFAYAELALWALSLVLPVLLLPGLFRLVRKLVERSLPRHTGAIAAWYTATLWPMVVVSTLAIHLAALSRFGPTLSFRFAYSRLIGVLLVAALAWTLQRAISVTFGRAGARLQDRGRTGVHSVMLLGERLLNVLILLLAVIFVLALVGFDMKAVLAGLGIFGVAVALGAQKTIENIIGGMMLLGDEAIALGDLVRINNRLGTVEDITLRSVRFRTFDNTLLSIPAGVLAQAELENFATRDRILMQHRLRLAYDTTAQQLHRIREELAEVIESHPELEHPLSRIRLVEFGPLGFELEIYANILTRDVPQSLATREELLLRVVTAVDAAGARFVQPPAAVAEPPR